MKQCKPIDLIEGIVFLDAESRKSKQKKQEEIDEKVKIEYTHIFPAETLETIRSNALNALSKAFEELQL